MLGGVDIGMEDRSGGRWKAVCLGIGWIIVPLNATKGDILPRFCSFSVRWVAFGGLCGTLNRGMTGRFVASGSVPRCIRLLDRCDSLPLLALRMLDGMLRCPPLGGAFGRARTWSVCYEVLQQPAIVPRSFVRHGGHLLDARGDDGLISSGISTLNVQMKTHRGFVPRCVVFWSNWRSRRAETDQPTTRRHVVIRCIARFLPRIASV